MRLAIERGQLLNREGAQRRLADLWMALRRQAKVFQEVRRRLALLRSKDRVPDLLLAQLRSEAGMRSAAVAKSPARLALSGGAESSSSGGKGKDRAAEMVRVGGPPVAQDSAAAVIDREQLAGVVRAAMQELKAEILAELRASKVTRTS
jgi:hypothetical protein